MAESLCLPGIFHMFDKSIYFFRLDSFQVVTYADIKLISVRGAKAIFLCHKRQQKPGLDILILRLWHVQLGRPFAVITLVLCPDTRFVHTGCQLLPVHFLDSFQFKKPAPGHIRRHNILRQLAVWPCRRSDHCFQFPSENLFRMICLSPVRSVYTEYISFFAIFCPYPVQKLFKWHTCHAVTHSLFLLVFRIFLSSSFFILFFYLPIFCSSVFNLSCM